MFLLAILGVNPVRKPAKKQKMVMCAHTTNQSERLCNLCTVNEHKTKDVQGPGPSNINLNLFVCFFDVHRIS